MSVRTITEIPEEKQAERGWRVNNVVVSGTIIVVSEIQSLRIANPKFGELAYGLTPEGFDGWRFHQLGGGGSMIVPYVLLGGRILVGVIQQARSTQGGAVWNVPRGFLDINTDHFQTAVSETAEEVGKAVSLAGRFFELPGEPTNPNSAFFETFGDEGDHFYGLRVFPEEVETIDGVVRFKTGLFMPVSKQAEQILGCKFLWWKEVIGLQDGYTVQGVGRLIAHLL